jgi:hypothetical protein
MAAVLCVLAGALWCLGGCGSLGLEGLVTTRVTVRSARQSLRDQVLGAYDELGDEVFALAGVRSVDPLTGNPTPPPPMTESQRLALEARRSMEFNRDDVLRFKRLGYAGESADGFLVVLDDGTKTLEQENPWLLDLVREVVAEENEDRRRIANRIVETTIELQVEDGPETLQAILAEKYRQEAEPGMKVQLPDGTWVSKGEGEGGA